MVERRWRLLLMFFIINLKKVCFILGIFLIGVFCFYGNITVESSIIPASVSNNKIIVIDAGHGEPDGGATSDSGVKEADLNLLIAKELEEALKENGYVVVMTRKDENNIASSDQQKPIRKMKVSDINNRIQLTNQSNADMLISIHMNKFNQSSSYGWQTFYKSNSEESKIIAENIQNGISANIDRANKRTALEIKKVKLIDQAAIPAVIVECGFLSNSEDLRLLQTTEYRNQIVNGILEGIEKYYERG